MCNTYIIYEIEKNWKISCLECSDSYINRKMCIYYVVTGS